MTDTAWAFPEPSSPEDAEPLKSALVAAEREIASLPEEWGVLIGPNGQELLRRQGDAIRLRFSTEDLSRMAGNLLTHNHPSGTSFSLDDAEFAMEHGLAGIRVVTSNARYSLRPSGAGWSAEFFAARVMPSVTRRYAEVKQELQELIDGRIIDPEEAEPRHWHQVWLRVAEDVGLIYTRTYWDDPSP
jgi:hypothetical protein